MSKVITGVSLILILLLSSQGFSEDGKSNFQAGFAKRDITPKKFTPMWGYGARHAALAIGTLKPLFAKAIVIHSGKGKVALVGLDLGRGPTPGMMDQIREAIQDKANIEHVMIVGSHTHHGPVIELSDRAGFGKGKYDSAVEYAKQLPLLLIEAILEADKNTVPAKIGVANRVDLKLNRNRHWKKPNKPVDPMLATIRLDDLSGKPIAVLVNFAAHPVMTDGKILKYSTDYPGFLEDYVEKELSTNCVFMQGACGDLSPNPVKSYRDPQSYGELLGEKVIELVKDLKTDVPKKPSLKGTVDHFMFASRIDMNSPFVAMAFGKAFFPEFVRNIIVELRDGHRTELNTLLLNGDIALVGGSGEFFCDHSNRLKSRSMIPTTLFFGYCNGHNLYFPTIEAVSLGGYGADATVSLVEIGAGERMMNQALINIYKLARRFRDIRIGPKKTETVKK